MGLFYFTLMQNQRCYYHTETNILQGHEKVVWDMQDVMDNWRVGSSPLNMTLHCRWGTHWKKTLWNWTEMWHKCDNFWACLQAPPLGWTRYLSFSVGRSTILWKNKKFTLLKFHRRILRPKHSGFISLHLQGQSWCFIQNHIKLLVQIPNRPCALLHWSSFHQWELTGSVSLLVEGSECNPVQSGWHCLL